MRKLFRHAAADIPASIVVFLVALPLCLGIALGSGTPIFSGIISGIIGGLVVGAISGSHLSISGPAAGLITVISLYMQELGSFQVLLLAVLIAGLIQILLALVKAGMIADFIPVAVIKGMMAAIGIMLILKQLPHLVGYDADFEGDESFFQPDGHNTFTELKMAWLQLTPFAMCLGLVGLAIQYVWDRPAMKKRQWTRFLPGPLLVVILSVVLNEAMKRLFPDFAIRAEHMVNVPVITNWDSLSSVLSSPDFSRIGDSTVWMAGITIGAIASLESLLSIEATDNLDPEGRISPPNRELLAQGVGNISAAFLGGLPVTAVVVRSTANISGGARTRLSALLHGVLLALLVLLLPSLLNRIPYAALAAILCYVGFKLASPSLVRQSYRLGWDVFLPFVITVVAILLSDLLLGVIIGLLVGVFFVIRSNFRKSLIVVHLDNNYMIKLMNQVSFLNKSLLKNALMNIPDESSLLFDFSKCIFADSDIRTMILEFAEDAPSRGIRVDYRFLNEDQKVKLKMPV
ncbi:MAG: SulP family inorganic anion transporter [Bacteroidetes bacterium]|nr:SulP family inorganic anion transporter [Bacteroidota bacterium]